MASAGAVETKGCEEDDDILFRRLMKMKGTREIIARYLPHMLGYYLINKDCEDELPPMDDMKYSMYVDIEHIIYYPEIIKFYVNNELIPSSLYLLCQIAKTGNHQLTTYLEQFTICCGNCKADDCKCYELIEKFMYEGEIVTETGKHVTELFEYGSCIPNKITYNFSGPFELGYESCIDFYSYADPCYYAALSGNFELFLDFATRYPVTYTSLYGAFRSKNKEMIEWVYDKIDYLEGVYSDVFDAACEYGEISYVIDLYRRDIHVESKWGKMHYLPTYYGCGAQHMHILQFIIDHKDEFEFYASSSVARTKKDDHIQYIIDNGLFNYTRGLEGALETYDIEYIDHFIETFLPRDFTFEMKQLKSIIMREKYKIFLHMIKKYDIEFDETIIKYSHVPDEDKLIHFLQQLIEEHGDKYKLTHELDTLFDYMIYRQMFQTLRFVVDNESYSLKEEILSPYKYKNSYSSEKYEEYILDEMRRFGFTIEDIDSDDD